MLNLVGVADCGANSREHRPREIVLRKTECGVSLIYNSQQSRGQDINGEIIGFVSVTILCITAVLIAVGYLTD